MLAAGAARADGGTIDVHGFVLRLPSTLAGALMRGAPLGASGTATQQAQVNNGVALAQTDVFDDHGPPVVKQAPALGGNLLIELPRAESNGTVRSPRLAFGFESPMLRSFVRDLGLDATHCMAPVLRGHLHLGSSPTGMMMLGVRCSLR
jgi:hypothetical protein